MKRTSKKVSRLESMQNKKLLLAYHQEGHGLYLFRNKSQFASLELPKISKDGKKWVEPNETWEGDSYFISMVPREAVIVKTLEEPKSETKETHMQEKLILDQPDQVDKSGKVEHKVEKDLPLNETNPNEFEKERLLTEDPLAGVTIIRD